MKHIKSYIDKIEAILVTQSSKENKPKSKGFLSSRMPEKDSGTEKRSELDVIAQFVYGIRKAKEEMTNGRK
jgi:hypothetical protein